MKRIIARLACVLATLPAALPAIMPATGAAADASVEAVSFSRDIRPLLSSRCFACHGPDGHSRAAGLRLDQPDGPEGSIGFAIEPGSADDSEMWLRITSDDEDTVMPPPDSHIKPLSEEERTLIRRWIEADAPYEDFWAFTPPVKSETPSAKTPGWDENPIDAFIDRRLVVAGAEPSPPADPRTLLRRVTFDLTGLPPTRDEIREFLAAYESSPQQAWNDCVDRLIDRPQYGEHMTRYWLDLVRFADTNGMHKDFYRDHVAYRDWVIGSFNDNLPYDDFVRYQVAGDLYPEPSREQLIASGFNRLHLIIDRGTALPEESRFKNGLDRVTAVGTAFMGLTVQCAQCHDHKFDPITQKDYFSLYAFFDNIDAAPETNGRAKRGLQPPFISLASTEQQEQLDGLDREIVEVKKQIDEVSQHLEALAEQMAADVKKAESETALASKTDPPPLATQAAATEKAATEKAAAEKAAAKKAAAEKAASEKAASEKAASEKAVAEKAAAEKAVADQQKATFEKQLKNLNQQRNQLNDTIPHAMVMKERDPIEPTYLRLRGAYDSLGEEVPRGTPGFLPRLQQSGDIASRMDLAEWFVAPENPLTARVAVNRFWQQLFGTGLVKTSEDLGNQGDVPSHPELLDYLAVSFVESGWDMKSLMKQMVLSQTYRQSSQASVDEFNQDPANRLLARGSRYRLDAEMIRDQVLATSGLLSDEMLGPSVKPPQPEGLWKAVSMIGEVYRPDSGDAIYRRSVYTFWKRGMPPPQMTILNAPIRDACIARRERTNTPLQALLLLNEPAYMTAAREVALATLCQPESQRIAFAWETITAKLPDERETAVMQELLDDLKAKYETAPQLAEELIAGTATEIAAGSPVAGSPVELAAWTIFVNTLYNLDITKTKD